MNENFNFRVFIVFCFTYSSLAFHIKFTKLYDDPMNNEKEGNDVFGELFKGIRQMIENDNLGALSHRVLNEKDGKVTTSKSMTLNSEVETKITELPNGVQKVEKLIEKQSEFFGFPNHTIKKIDVVRENSEEKRNETIVGCVNNEDCNTTSYCNKLSYNCETCHSRQESCASTYECCVGFTCDIDTKTCKKREGMSGDLCVSSSDCNAEHCCVLNSNGDGECQPYLKEGEDCSKDPFTSLLSFPFMQDSATNDLPNKCPCMSGLSCVKQPSILILPTQRCLKPKPNKKILRIHFKQLPSLHYHDNNEDEENLFYSPFKSSKIRVKQHAVHPNKVKNPVDDEENEINEHARRYHSKHKHRNLKQNKRSTIPFLDIMSPFSDILESMDDDSPDEEIDEDDILDGISQRRKHELNQRHRTKREFVEDVSSKAREAVHDAVDGIFDNIMQGVIEAMKYRE